MQMQHAGGIEVTGAALLTPPLAATLRLHL